MKFPMIWITFLIGLSILSSSLCSLAQPAGEYTNRRISMDFRDADMRNVLKLIAEVGEC
jgi:hypothetical protein